MIELPLISVPSQKINVILNGQNVTFILYTKGKHMYSDLYVNDTPLWLARICLNGVLQKQYDCIPFVGDILPAGIIDYTKIPEECSFYYVTPDEVEEYEPEKH